MLAGCAWQMARQQRDPYKQAEECSHHPCQLVQITHTYAREVCERDKKGGEGKETQQTVNGVFWDMLGGRQEDVNCVLYMDVFNTVCEAAKDC